jgi:hypothetical protein
VRDAFLATLPLEDPPVRPTFVLIRKLSTVIFAAGVPILTACGDGGTGPGQVDLSGLYYGTASYGDATCDGEPPPGSSLTGFAIPLLLDLSQTGTAVRAADLADTLHYVGTFEDADGGLASRLRLVPEGADFVVVADTITTHVEGDPSVLTGTGQRVDSVHRETAGQPELHCTRPITWDLTRRSQPVPELEPVACSREAELRPSGSLSSTLLLFRNQRSEPVDIYKLDPAGARVPLDHLEPGEVRGIGALNNAVEPVVVTRTDGGCLGIYLPAEGPTYVHLK